MEKEFDFSEFPSDNYGVFVENDMDRRRLQWLVAEIGEKKLRSSVAKYHKKYPDNLPFVSLLLKWYGRKVPTKVYAPQRIPIFGVYLLMHTQTARVKVGTSSNWTTRARSFVKLNKKIEERFDIDQSKFGACDSSTAARLLERTLLDATVEYRCDPPSGIPWGAGGKSEWRLGCVYFELMHLLTVRSPRAPLLSFREGAAQKALLADASGPAGRLGTVCKTGLASINPRRSRAHVA